jgi:sterol desaturase/sphingolipid hydroxylase (fatty acid hydroxylase superfamily)
MTQDPILPDLVILSLPGFLILIAAEIGDCYLRGKMAYEIRDTTASLLMGLGNLAIGVPTGIAIYFAWSWIAQFRLFDLGYAWWSFLLVLLADDVTHYWAHRLSHRIRFWWAMHVNHHSSQHFNLSTALRQPWTDRLSFAWLFWVPMILLGFPPLLVIFQRKVSLVYQFWLHTESIGRLPRWFEAIMNTPSHHRVHHAANPCYLDRNYAGILIVWDKLFGTFAPELERCDYGIVKNIGTFNPLRIAFHEWIALAKDMVRAGSWRERFIYAFGLPGRSFDGSRRTTDQIRAEWEATRTSHGQPDHDSGARQPPDGDGPILPSRRRIPWGKSALASFAVVGPTRPLHSESTHDEPVQA